MLTKLASLAMFSTDVVLHVTRHLVGNSFVGDHQEGRSGSARRRQTEEACVKQMGELLTPNSPGPRC
jgi:hypothetical protein